MQLLLGSFQDLFYFKKMDIELGYPTCFYGEYYHGERKKRLSELFGSAEPETVENLHATETRSVLIIHNLEKMNYVQKESNVKLKLWETKAVLFEISQIHAASWVWQQKNGRKPMFEKFPFLLHPRRSVPVSVVSMSISTYYATSSAIM